MMSILAPARPRPRRRRGPAQVPPPGAARERLLSDALAKAAPGETPNKLADDAKRPRLISFDDK